MPTNAESVREKKIVGLSISQWLPCPLTFGGNIVQSCQITARPTAGIYKLQRNNSFDDNAPVRVIKSMSLKATCVRDTVRIPDQIKTSAVRVVDTYAQRWLHKTFVTKRSLSLLMFTGTIPLVSRTSLVKCPRFHITASVTVQRAPCTVQRAPCTV